MDRASVLYCPNSPSLPTPCGPISLSLTPLTLKVGNASTTADFCFLLHGNPCLPSPVPNPSLQEPSELA